MGNKVMGNRVNLVTIAPLIGKKFEDIGAAGAAGGVQVTTVVPLNLGFQR